MKAARTFWKYAGAITVGVLSTVLLSDYSTFRHHGGGQPNGGRVHGSIMTGSYLLTKWTMLLNHGGDTASHRQDPTKLGHQDITSLLFCEPSPSILVAAILAYSLAFRQIHVALLSRSRYHIHILVMGSIAGLLSAYMGGFDLLDTGLCVMPMSVNISLLLSYLTGLQWVAAASMLSEKNGVYNNSMSKDKNNEPWSSAC